MCENPLGIICVECNESRQQQQKKYILKICPPHSALSYERPVCTALDPCCMIQCAGRPNPFYPYAARLQHENVYCRHNLFQPVSSGWRVQSTV